VRVSLPRLSLARTLNAGDPVRTDSGIASSAGTPSAPTASGPRKSQTSSTRPAATKDDATRAPPSTINRAHYGGYRGEFWEPTGLPGPSGLRRFPHAELAQPMPPLGHGLPDDAAAFLVLATADDQPEDRLRAGEALSSVVLTATRAGLATTPLSQATEVTTSRELLREVVGIPEQPQLVLRVGWAATRAAELPDTPRRDLASVLIHGQTPIGSRRP